VKFSSKQNICKLGLVLLLSFLKPILRYFIQRSDSPWNHFVRKVYIVRIGLAVLFFVRDCHWNQLTHVLWEGREYLHTQTGSQTVEILFLDYDTCCRMIRFLSHLECTIIRIFMTDCVTYCRNFISVLHIDLLSGYVSLWKC